MKEKLNYFQVEKSNVVSKTMRLVYFYMAIGLLVSAVMAYMFANVPELYNMLYNTKEDGQIGMSVIGFVVLFSPLAILIFGKKDNMDSKQIFAMFILIAGLIGASLSSIILVYTEASIVLAFGVTSGMFFVTSIFGYVTARDLSSLSGILMTALIGIIIAMLVNMFIGSDKIDYIISFVAVVVFTVMMAYDTQRIKKELYNHSSKEEIKRVAIWGAFSLYLDFINLMLHILNLLGKKK